MKKFIRRIAVLFVLLFQINAHAIFGVGDVVWDPGNYVANYTSSLNSVKNYSQTLLNYKKQLDQYVLQGKQAEDLVKNTRSMVKDPKLADFLGESARVQAAIKATNGVENALKQNGTMAETIKSLYGASGKSPKTFAEDVAARRTAGNQYLNQTMTSYENSNKTLQDSVADLNTVSGTLKSQPGTNELLVALNKTIGITVGQNNALIEATQVQKLQTAKKLAEDDKSEQYKEYANARYNERKANFERDLKESQKVIQHP